eukprot:2526397-Amphidinium_carterae.1
MACPPCVELCISGCGKPTWNGMPGEYCTISCRDKASSCPPTGSPLCVSGCGKPTWNGAPGEYCSKTCRRVNMGGTDSRSTSWLRRPRSGSSSWTLRPRSVCRRSPSWSRPVSSISRKFEPTQLSATDQDYIDIFNQCTKSWSGTKLNMPKIDAIWSVTNPVLRAKYEGHCSQDGLKDARVYGHGRNPGNRQRRMHGSMMKHQFDGTVCTDRGCKVCCIMRDGFKM